MLLAKLKSKIKHIHFIGIGGAGMSALAELTHQMGYSVSGSDVSYSLVIDQLINNYGIQFYQGHDGQNVKMADLVIYSTAINGENPEIIRAHQLNKPVINRIEYLSYLMENKFGITITGTHGKTTTTALVSSILVSAGLDPTYVVGGIVKPHMKSGQLGKSEYFISEGDESNDCFLRLNTNIAVITNIDDDHLNFYKTIDRLFDSFRTFINKIPEHGKIIACLDCPNIRRIIGEVRRPIITYAINNQADYVARNITQHKMGHTFDVFHSERGKLGTIKINRPGLYNIQNALAGLAVADSLGVPFGTAAFGLENFDGVKRRFDTLYEGMGVKVIDDYAHHPTEIDVLLKTIRKFHNGRIRAVFQPHRYTRSKEQAERYPKALSTADEIILTDIYAAGESMIEGVNANYLYSFFDELPDGKAHLIKNRTDVIEYLFDTTRSGDLIITIGAGDINKFGEELSFRYREQQKLGAYQHEEANFQPMLILPDEYPDNVKPVLEEITKKAQAQ